MSGRKEGKRFSLPNELQRPLGFPQEASPEPQRYDNFQ